MLSLNTSYGLILYSPFFPHSDLSFFLETTKVIGILEVLSNLILLINLWSLQMRKWIAVKANKTVQGHRDTT